MSRSDGSPERRPTASVIIPAHNEAAGIGRSLTALLADATPGEFEILVICNGCTDDTADVARQFGETVRVIETKIPSKTAALNLGDQAATCFPRVYLDADVKLSTSSLRSLIAPLIDGTALAAAPAVETIFKQGAAWSVRAYYRFWMSLPFVQEGMMAAGVYAVSKTGHERFAPFPDLISDDGYVRLHFSNRERVEVASAVSEVIAPAAWPDLIRIKTRSRLGVYQLETRYASLFADERVSKNYAAALMSIVRRPELYASAIPFLLVSLISRYRARKQFTAQEPYVWERDLSSRE